MKLVTNSAGRVLYSLVPDEIHPIEGIHAPLFIRLLAEKYAFASLPDNVSFVSGPMIFRDGIFMVENKKMQIAEFTVYTDAISVISGNTNLSEKILDDFLIWAMSTCNFRKPVTAPFKVYQNNAIVEFNKPMEAVLGVFSEFSHLFAVSLKQFYQKDFSIGFQGLSMSVDPLELPKGPLSLVSPDFNITRRLDVPFSSNRFFCSAPLPTEVHLKLLESFERLALK